MSQVLDGIIKYDPSGFSHTSPIPIDEYSDLDYWRNRLYLLGLIGIYQENQIGFGNVSLRKNYRHLHDTNHSQFIITGTQTASIKQLTGEHYTRILDFDIETFNLRVAGPIMASSEAITHAALYDLDDEINTVFHIHCPRMWEKMISENFISTPKDILYGTKEMAEEMKKIVKTHGPEIFVMEGHRDGITAYGPDLESTGQLIIQTHESL